MRETFVMPELPDVELYLERLTAALSGARLDGMRIKSPSLLRTVEPPLGNAFGRRVCSFERLGKRLVFGLEGDLYLVLHLMIAGRLRLLARGAGIPGKIGMAAFDFDRAALVLTEASTHKRTQLHLVTGRDALAAHDPGGIEVLQCGLSEFRDAVRRESHTLKRTLTDPHLLSGIGNAYSDEILHRARMSPVRLSRQLDDDEIATLFEACRSVLTEWTERLRAQVGERWPEKVTAFRPEMAVHGRYGKPCPVCGSKVQRIVHAKNETNYCAVCQTGGKLLADRALSRLLKQDWPKTLTELEERMQRMRETRAAPSDAATPEVPCGRSAGGSRKAGGRKKSGKA